MSRRIPWIALALLTGGAALLLGARLTEGHAGLLPACPLKTLLHIPCPSCGSTRAILALAQGRWAEAFRWQPVGLALACLSPLAALWDLRRAWRNEPYPPLPDSLPARLAVAGLLLGTWVVQIVRGV